MFGEFGGSCGSGDFSCSSDSGSLAPLPFEHLAGNLAYYIYIYIYTYIYIYIYIRHTIYIYIYIYIYIPGRQNRPAAKVARDARAPLASLRKTGPSPDKLRGMEGAPRNPAPRCHFLVQIVKPSGCLCTDGHLTSRVFTEDQTIS